MTSTCTRLLDFDYGHKVLNHGNGVGKCAMAHGHRGKVEITVGCETLDGLGMVIDFGKIKEVVGGWIDTNWDHTMILHKDDPLNLYPLVLGPRQVYILPEGNPTAENLAKHLYEKAVELLKPFSIEVVSIVFWETPNCSARYPGTLTTTCGG